MLHVLHLSFFVDVSFAVEHKKTLCVSRSNILPGFCSSALPSTEHSKSSVLSLKEEEEVPHRSTRALTRTSAFLSAGPSLWLI